MVAASTKPETWESCYQIMISRGIENAFPIPLNIFRALLSAIKEDNVLFMSIETHPQVLITAQAN